MKTVSRNFRLLVWIEVILWLPILARYNPVSFSSTCPEMLFFIFLIFAVSVFGQEVDTSIDPILTSVTVRDTLQTESSGYVTSIEAEELESRPGVNVDDRLRDIPGFSLFRRSSSLVAHPTTQGISLRGIGSSAAGRTLVLYDSFPANDPVGGWGYWSRINPDTVDVIEISRGATTSAYGDRAMGGVVSVRSRASDTRHIWSSIEGGGAGIADIRGGFTDLYGKLGISSFVRAVRSEGYYIVQKDLRGSVDRRADADFLVGDVRLDYFGSNERLSFKTNILGEHRQNATALRENSSSIGTTGLNYQRGGLAVNVYHSRSALRNSFSFVNSARNFEKLVLLQRVNSDDTGGSVIWNRNGRNTNILVGADAHRAEGLSADTVVSTGFVRRPGGRLWQQGTFVQGDIALSSGVQFLGGLRHDFTDRGNDFWSPRGGVVIAEGSRRWRMSAFRSFRSPTLNEFFRQFRVGNITTLGNEELQPETMISVDTGVDWHLTSFMVRTTLFWQQIGDLIGNATIRTEPTPLRQRQNMGNGVSRGVEFEIQKSLRNIRLEGAYLFVDSQLSTKHWMPQTPRHQGSLQILYATDKTLFSVGLRSYASQFEDDLNRFVLPGFATVQLKVKRELAKGVSTLLALDNAFNRRFLVGFSPTPTIGSPRLLRVGLQWDLKK